MDGEREEKIVPHLLFIKGIVPRSIGQWICWSNLEFVWTVGSTTFHNS